MKQETARSGGSLNGLPTTLEPDEPDLIRDALWTYAHLDHPRVEREDAPSEGAWSLLSWASEARNRFFEQVLPKAMTAGEDPQPKPVNHARVELYRQGLRDHARLLVDAVRGRAFDDVPEAIRQDASEVLAEWTEESGLALSASALEEIHIDLCLLVGRCARIAAGFPDQFDDSGEPTDSIDQGGHNVGE